MYRYPFAVRNEPYCVWEHDLPERNERFLRSFDPRFFRYLTDVHVPHLEGENAQRAAVGLRSAYHHGIETLFALLGALAQAPGCVAGWLPKCSTRTLRALVHDISSGRPVLTQRGRQVLSWSILSSIVHSWVWLDETPKGATASRFGDLWTRLAGEFLDEHHAAEYNSIKHGFRISAGGFAIRIGLEHEYAVPPPESEMHWLGGSPHGIGYFMPESIQGLGEECKLHFRIRSTHINWRAEGMAQALQLLSMSINNIIGALRVLNGSKPSTVQFERPEDAAFFHAPWNWSLGLTQGAFDYVIEAHEVKCKPRASVLTELESRTSDTLPGGHA